MLFSDIVHAEEQFRPTLPSASSSPRLHCSRLFRSTHSFDGLFLNAFNSLPLTFHSEASSRLCPYEAVTHPTVPFLPWRFEPSPGMNNPQLSRGPISLQCLLPPAEREAHNPSTCNRELYPRQKNH